MRPSLALGCLLAALSLTGCGSDEAQGQPAASSLVDEASHLSLVADSLAFRTDLIAYQAAEAEYPLATASDVASVTQTPLGQGVRVHTYVLTGTGPVFCLVNAMNDDWVRVDVASGAMLNPTPGSPQCGEAIITVLD